MDASLHEVEEVEPPHCIQDKSDSEKHDTKQICHVIRAYPNTLSLLAVKVKLKLLPSLLDTYYRHRAENNLYK